MGADLLQALVLVLCTLEHSYRCRCLHGALQIGVPKRKQAIVSNWVTSLSVWMEGLLPSTWHLHHLGTSQSSKVRIQIFDSAPFTSIGGEW